MKPLIPKSGKVRKVCHHPLPQSRLLIFLKKKLVDDLKHSHGCRTGIYKEDAEALKRIQNGTYGECIDCGETIDVERLQEHPTVTRCCSCQAHRDQMKGRKKKAPNHSSSVV